MGVLDQEIRCSDCKESYSLEKWIKNNGRCVACTTEHIIPLLHIAKKSIESGDFRGGNFQDIIERYRLDVSDATNLLLLLGCSEGAAIDIERVVLQNWPRIDWRRTIGRTREKELQHYEEVSEILSQYGVSIDIPEE